MPEKRRPSCQSQSARQALLPTRHALKELIIDVVIVSLVRFLLYFIMHVKDDELLPLGGDDADREPLHEGSSPFSAGVR